MKKFFLKHSLFYYVLQLGIKLSILSNLSTQPHHWVISPNSPKLPHKTKLKISIQFHRVPLPVPLCLARFIRPLDLSPSTVSQRKSFMTSLTRSNLLTLCNTCAFAVLCLFTCLFDLASYAHWNTSSSRAEILQLCTSLYLACCIGYK